MLTVSELITQSDDDRNEPKSRLAIITDYFTGGHGGEFDTYRDPDLYDRGAHSRLYRRDNLAEGVASVVEAQHPSSGELSVLDIGAGTGILTLKLAQRGMHVAALDLFGEPLAKLREKSTNCNLTNNVATVRADMNVGLPFSDNSFNSAVSLRATRYIIDFSGWLSEIHRVLKPDGNFVLPVFAIDAVPWKRHSALGIMQATSARRVMSAVVSADFEIDREASGRYARVADTERGQQGIPFYYKPTFVVAKKRGPTVE